MTVPWELVLALAAALAALFLLNDWISRHLQGIGLLITGHPEGGMVLAWLIFLPGIVLHEASHWVVAHLLGLRPSRLRVWPERRGKLVRMGYVDFRAGGLLRDSLVGLAPFLTGCAVLLGVAAQVFGFDGQTGWREAIQSVLSGLHQADLWLFIYLIFTVSNGMMPSASDRQAWGSLLLYMLLVAAGLYTLDLLPALSPEVIAHLFKGVQALVYALGLAVAVDLPIALGIGIIEWTLSALKGQRVVY
ncbi:MAG: hypothetical protein RML36_03780 [Anaerolineae bacterium]|nr:hypothetical protein [Anaerolineae bacterium]MDW8098590.1 hypothetical protein [Anaerolineae bacterium]